LSVVFAEAQIVFSNIQREALVLDSDMREMTECTFQPSFNSIETRNRLAKKAEDRHIAEQSASRSEVKEEELTEVDEMKRVRTEKKQSEKRRHNREFKIPFKRRTEMSVLTRP
jgi:hypothetical protein